MCGAVVVVLLPDSSEVSGVLESKPPRGLLSCRTTGSFHLKPGCLAAPSLLQATHPTTPLTLLKATVNPTTLAGCCFSETLLCPSRVRHHSSLRATENEKGSLPAPSGHTSAAATATAPTPPVAQLQDAAASPSSRKIRVRTSALWKMVLASDLSVRSKTFLS